MLWKQQYCIQVHVNLKFFSKVHPNVFEIPQGHAARTLLLVTEIKYYVEIKANNFAAQHKTFYCTYTYYNENENSVFWLSFN